MKPLKNKMKIIVPMACAVLAGCGGGGEDLDFWRPLAEYAGTYSKCDGGIKTHFVITEASELTVNISSTADFYPNADCTGSILATQTEPIPIQAKYVSNSTVVAKGTLAEKGLPLQPVDDVQFTAPAMNKPITGPAVSINAQGQTCIQYPDFPVCLDSSASPAVNDRGALGRNGDYLFVFRTDSSLYYLANIFQR